MGNGVWTVEIIPAEIRPPARSVAGASGNRIRLGSRRVTNGGNETDLVVAFNEQVLLGRVQAGELKPGCIVLLESKWREDPDATIAASYVAIHDQLVTAGYKVHEIPMERECLTVVADARRGKNMFALGMLCNLYSLDLQLAREQIALTFGKKDASVIKSNVKLLEAGHDWAERNLDLKFRIPAERVTEPQIVINGNTALALGILASGMEVCAMYPITPATSASHYLSDVFEKVGGVVHQAEDEIAACAFAIGASYAGKCTVTITSGPGFSLKQEAIGLAVMGEIPLVVVNVQRGGPSAPASRPRRSRATSWLPCSAVTAMRPRWSWRRARSRTASIRSSPRARSPRPSTWSWSSFPTPIWPPPSSRSRGRNSARRGWRRRSIKARLPDRREAIRLGRHDRPRAPLHTGSA